MNRTPAISIVLPFRDAQDTLPECLESIAAQTFDDYELLAVDDGSRDRSAAQVSARAGNDRRIRLLRNPRRGIVAALNLGLAQARAPLVARMDADDRMHPERLRDQFRFLSRHPEVHLVGSRVRLFPEHIIRSGYREYVRWQNTCLEPASISEQIYIESPFAHPSVTFRLHTIRVLGGYRHGDFPEDYDLWLRMHQAGYRMAKLPRVLLDWREHTARASRTDLRYRREAFDRLRAGYLARDTRLQDGRPLAYWGAGRKTRRRSELLIRHGFAPAAWIDIDPRKIGNTLDGVPVVAPHWLADRQQRPFVLGYVTNHGAREQIAQALHAMAFLPGKDYLMIG